MTSGGTVSGTAVVVVVCSWGSFSELTSGTSVVVVVVASVVVVAAVVVVGGWGAEVDGSKLKTCFFFQYYCFVIKILIWKKFNC